jgi:hypothetical protein
MTGRLKVLNDAEIEVGAAVEWGDGVMSAAGSKR